MSDIHMPTRHDVELRAADDPEDHGDWCYVTIYSAEGDCLAQVEVGLDQEFGHAIVVSTVLQAGVELKTVTDARIEGESTMNLHEAIAAFARTHPEEWEELQPYIEWGDTKPVDAVPVQPEPLEGGDHNPESDECETCGGTGYHTFDPPVGAHDANQTEPCPDCGARSDQPKGDE